jgi:hypothetical protein
VTFSQRFPARPACHVDASGEKTSCRGSVAGRLVSLQVTVGPYRPRSSLLKRADRWTAAIALVLALIVPLRLASRAAAADGRGLEIVARTGDSNIVSIEPEVSINANGTVAFVASTPRTDGRPQQNLYTGTANPTIVRKLLADSFMLPESGDAPLNASVRGCSSTIMTW